MRLLWVTAIAPSYDAGGGGEIRQAHLLDALADRFEVHLLLAGNLHDERVRARLSSVREVPVKLEDDPPGQMRRRLRDIRWLVVERRSDEVARQTKIRRALSPLIAAPPEPDIVCIEYIGLAPLLPPRRHGFWALTLHNLTSEMARHNAVIAPGRRQRMSRLADTRANESGGAGAYAMQVGVQARRAVLRTLRQPAQIAPSLFYPLMMLAVNASGLSSATLLHGFPTHSYLTFALAVPFMQTALFAVINAGTDIAGDVETGFLDRLQLTPVRAAALLAGELAGVIAFGVATAVVYVAVGLAFGAHIAAGPAGVLVLLALAAVIALGFGALGAVAALRTGSAEAVQGLFPVFFVFLFLSSMYLPLNLIRAHWFHTIATWNPISYVLEGIRSVLIHGWDATALGRAFVITIAIAVIGLASASLALRSRMGRT